MGKKALIVFGAWQGHHPKECADLFAARLPKEGFDVELSETLDVYLDKAKMDSASVIVPMWTMGQITKEQLKGLLEAVKGGVGIAGFHGGMGDSFRNNPEYQFMVGGQWVSHPGGKVPSYVINIVDHDHPITKGVKDFTMTDTEQYYMHVDPSNTVLAKTTCLNGAVMPAVWTRAWGQGKVFYASYGHTEKDFEVPEAYEIVKRGVVWASR